MAKYIAIIVSLFFFVFSVHSVVPDDKRQDPSKEIIKQEDAEEGYDLRHIQESLVCEDPKRDSNMVTYISGDRLHMSSKAYVTCDAGKHFTGQSANKTMVTVICTPLPHPCMCMAAWQTVDDYQLVYDFDCTSDIEDNMNKKPESANDDFPIYPFKEKDDPQCPDPTPVRGTMKILHGHPYSYGCNVLLTCDPGLVFGDGKSVWNLTCLGLSVMPPQCIWAPVHDGRPICKDDLQCTDPSPIRGTLKVLSGKPFTDGCTVSLVCDPGLVFSDGKAVMNTTCVPVPHIPPAMFWIPQFNGTPTCREPEISDTNKETTEFENNEANTEEEVPAGAVTNADEQTDIPEDITSNEPRENEVAETETGNALEENSENDGIPEHDTTYSQENSDFASNEEKDTYGPEEDLDGTFLENYIETTDNEENDLDNNDEIILASELEAREEFTNTISDSVINANTIEYPNTETTETEERMNENEENNDQLEIEPEETHSEVEQHASQDETSEKENMPEEKENGIVNEGENELETLLEENDDEHNIILLVEENTAEEHVEISEDEDVEWNEMSETENMPEEKENRIVNEGENELETLLEENDDEHTLLVEENTAEEHVEISEDEDVEWNEIHETENEEQIINEEDDEEKEEEEEENEEEIQGEEQTEENEINAEEPEKDQEIAEFETDIETIPTDNDSGEDKTLEGENEEFEEEEERMSIENVKGLSNEHSDYFVGKNEEENDKEQEILLDEVYPLQPPTIKESSIIYATIKESSLFDKEESEEEVEDNSNDSLVYEDVEPPGYLLDIQTVPVEASKEEIETEEDNCSLPAETGPCRAYFRRFFFNTKTQECDVFVYGGCSGNGNNFKSLNDCENACGRKVNL